MKGYRGIIQRLKKVGEKGNSGEEEKKATQQ